MASRRQLADTCQLWPNYTSGLLAGVVNVAATFPINKVIFRQQINSSRFTAAVKEVSSCKIIALLPKLFHPVLIVNNLVKHVIYDSNFLYMCMKQTARHFLSFVIFRFTEKDYLCFIVEWLSRFVKSLSKWG